jgi:hypothetical protein
VDKREESFLRNIGLVLLGNGVFNGNEQLRKKNLSS